MVELTVKMLNLQLDQVKNPLERAEGTSRRGDTTAPSASHLSTPTEITTTTHSASQLSPTTSTLSSSTSSSLGGSRRCFEKGDWIKFSQGWRQGEEVYVGRGAPERGLPRSKWANPFHIGKDGSREVVLERFRKHAVAGFTEEDLGTLRGCTLVCHCKLTERCHGDILLSLIPAGERHHEDLEDGLPLRIAECKEEEEDKNDEDCDDQDEVVPPGTWPGWTGRGPPRSVKVMGKARSFQDGGGAAPRVVAPPRGDSSRQWNRGG